MAPFLWMVLVLTCSLWSRSWAHLPLVQKPQPMVSAECQTLLHQCGDELGLFAQSAHVTPTATSTTPVSVTLEPVCGSDGRTYSSRCELQRARCEGHPVQVHHHGSCHGEEKRCWAERRFAQKTARRHNETSTRSVGETFIPECTEDGRFAEIQCHKGTGYCWCVTPDGKPIPGSSIRHKKPNCKRQGKSVTSRRSPSLNKKRRGCGSSDKAAFNGHILRLFTTEYNRIPQTATSSSKHKSSESAPEGLEKKVIDWKFDQLDKNGDGFLNRREFRVLRRLVRKMVRPRRCSKNFPRVCDSDRDRKISRTEWSTCLGIGINKDSSEESAMDSANLPVKADLDSLMWTKHTVSLQEASSAEDNDQVEANDCYSDRQAALDEVKHGAQGMYVPECTPDNKYQRVQCHKSTGYCWCAQEETGKPIPGTSVQNGKPSCDNPHPPPAITRTTPPPPPPKEERPRYQPLSAEAACPGKRKQKLQSDMAEFFKENMAAVLANKTGNNAIPGPDYSLPPRERVARWQLKQLDKNSNNVIDRQEMRELRLLLKRSPKVRRCSKKIPAFCDVNGDKRITTEEWLLCLGATKQVSNIASPLATTGSSGKRRGPNPLSTYLKDR